MSGTLLGFLFALLLRGWPRLDPRCNQLLHALERLDREHISYCLFDEPDDAMGFTAACTEGAPACRLLRRYALWKSH